MESLSFCLPTQHNMHKYIFDHCRLLRVLHDPLEKLFHMNTLFLSEILAF